MNLHQLIDALAQPAAYPYAVARVDVCQTHISVVFLAGDFVYKIKKPVALGFLDFRTLDQRRHFCEEEVRLNRRLAPEVYLGVVPISDHAGQLRLEGEGEPIEWAVKMRRLPAEATLLRYFERGKLSEGTVAALAERIADFHRQAESSPSIAEFGRFDIVAANARDNIAQASNQVGAAISATVLERLRSLIEEHLARLRPLIEARAQRGMPRDTHGDLHLDHVYCFPDRQPPADLVVIDCIEFNERFRYSDPIADMAFLVMDFTFQGRHDFARTFADAYMRAANDEEGRSLIPWYSAYRSAVRGKVEGMKSTEAEVPAEERQRALMSSRAHWLLALSELESPDRRPCLILTGGLPGAGKSTLARGLARHAGVEVIRSDVVRKELAATTGIDVADKQVLYSAEWTERTYAECRRRAEAMLFEGRRVLVDASFVEEARRRTLLEAARHWSVPAVFIVCTTDAETAKQRLAARHGDASDADWSIHQLAATRWEPPGEPTRSVLREISTHGSTEEALASALEVLRQVGL